MVYWYDEYRKTKVGGIDAAICFSIPACYAPIRKKSKKMTFHSLHIRCGAITPCRRGRRQGEKSADRSVCRGGRATCGTRQPDARRPAFGDIGRSSLARHPHCFHVTLAGSRERMT
jgi:hypothetical protein